MVMRLGYYDEDIVYATKRRNYADFDPELVVDEFDGYYRMVVVLSSKEDMELREGGEAFPYMVWQEDFEHHDSPLFSRTPVQPYATLEEAKAIADHMFEYNDLPPDQTDDD